MTPLLPDELLSIFSQLRYARSNGKDTRVVDAEGVSTMLADVPLDAVNLHCFVGIECRHPLQSGYEESVPNARQVVGQLFDRVGCNARLYCFWVVCQEECLFRLHNNDSFLSLSTWSQLIARKEDPLWRLRHVGAEQGKRVFADLLPVQTSVVRF